MEYVFQRGNWYHYKRRIPSYLAHYYDNEFIQASLKTDSLRAAKQRAVLINSEVERIWAELEFSSGGNNSITSVSASDIVKSYGFSHFSMEQVSSARTSEIVGRVMSVEPIIGKEPETVAAVLGNAKKQSISLSEALVRFFVFHESDLTGKSEHQIRKWRNPRIKALENFKSLIGDIPVNSLQREHMLRLREWWQHRIKNEGLSTGSANKDFTHLRTLISFIRDDKNLDIDINDLFSRMQFSNKTNSRPPIPTNHIKSHLLNLANLEGLHDEAKIFLFAMADTGARPSELLGLNANNGDIRLDTEIPYIHIRPEKDKALKTPHSERQIPLVGSSLFAFQKLPNGFVHYHRKSDQLSANLNKFLREHNLLPSEDHSIYSLRHSFEDRLTAVEPPEKVQAALMGHKYARPRYGDGPSLEQKKKWLDMICFKV